MVSTKSLIAISSLAIPMVAAAQDASVLRRDVDAILKSANGVFAVAFDPLDRGDCFLINEREMFHAASTMKTPVMIEVFRQAHEGRFSLDDSLTVKNQFASLVDGSPYALDLGDDSDDSVYRKIGMRITIRELVSHMITVSSNLATNILMELVGASNVTATMRTLGANDIAILRGVEDGKAFAAGLNNTTNAFDLMVIMRALANGEAVDSANSREMIAILRGQHFRDIIPALLPESVQVAHKTGSITGVEHDSGIVYLPDGRRYVLVLLSKDLNNAAEGKKALALVSKRIYEYMTGRN